MRPGASGVGPRSFIWILLVLGHEVAGSEHDVRARPYVGAEREVRGEGHASVGLGDVLEAIPLAPGRGKDLCREFRRLIGYGEALPRLLVDEDEKRLVGIRRRLHVVV